MKIEQIASYEELADRIQNRERSYLLLYKKGNESSDCAIQHLSGTQVAEDLHVFAADVATVRDIHSRYNITTVPSLLEFEGGKYKNVLKGCHDTGFYQSYFENIVYQLRTGSDEKPSKSVTVYTTPSCPWCTTLKNFLRKNGVRYTEVDVASDEQAARDMVSKSGQQGVPQTDIDGQMVLGFDQSKLNRLLELK